MAITIKDVAKEAGVATSTVSRTIKDHSSISKETKQRVRKAMKKLGYVPNAAAQNLASKTTKNIGMIFPPFEDEEKASDPFFMEILNVVTRTCNQNDYIVSVASGNNLDELFSSVKLMYQYKRVDGFILMYSMENDPIAAFLHENEVPFVMVGSPYEKENETVYVDNDNYLSGKTATQYLIDRGHKKIVFAGFDQHQRVYQERYEGYRMLMMNHEYASTKYFKVTDVTDYLEFIEYLDDEKPTAIIAVDDVFSLKLIQVLRQRKLNVGEDISLISFNNSFFSTLTHPYLTTVNIHTELLGSESALALLDHLKEPTKNKMKIIVPHEVITRETVLDLRKI